MIVLRPSQAKRWLTCTASPRFIEENKLKLDFTAGAAADEGTLAHKCAELLARGKNVTWPNPEMRKHVSRFHRLPSLPGSIVSGIEETLPLFYNETDQGTTDRWFASKDTVLIRDLKYGKGVLVDAEDNPQLLIYARNVYEFLLQHQTLTFRFKWVIMEIFQPRAQEGDPWKVWKLPIADFLKRTDAIRRQAELVQYGIDEEFRPSTEACRFCPAKPICGAYVKHTLNLVPVKALPIELPQVESLSPTQLGQILTARKAFDQWFEAAQAHAIHRFSLGEEVPGWMMARGRANRQWKNVKAAVKWMTKQKIDPWEEPKLVSPAKAEEQIDGDVPESLVVKPEGKPTLAPADSGRQPDRPMTDPKKVFAPIDTPMVDKANRGTSCPSVFRMISTSTKAVRSKNSKPGKRHAR